MYRTYQKGSSRGLAAVEMVIGLSLAALILVFVTHAIVRFVSVGRDVATQTEALYLAEEALELVRYVRDTDWDEVGDLTNNTPYYLYVDAFVAITGTPETIGDFSRHFYIDDVYRNANDEIVASTTAGAAADPDAKYVTSVVSWGSPQKTVTLTTILAQSAP